MSDLVFTPVNRHLQVTLQTPEQQTPSGVLLPEDFATENEKYEKVKILAASSDCKEVFRSSVGSHAFVEKSMIQNLIVARNKVSLVLENYIIGVIS